MFFRVLLAALVGAAIGFGWGYVFWDRLPMAKEQMLRTPDDEQAQAALRKHFPQSGSYFVPMPSGPNDQAAERRHQAGPIAHVHVEHQGGPMMDPKMFGYGFAHFFVSALLLAVLLAMAVRALPSFLGRVFFLTVAGLFAAVFVRLADPIWWKHPWNWDLMAAGYETGTWLLAGIFMAAIIRPPREEAAEK